MARLRNITSVISRDIFAAFADNLFIMLVLALITAIICLFVFAYNKKTHKGKGRFAFPLYALSLIVFIPYVYAIFQIAFFSRETGSRNAVADFMPFVTWGRTAVTNAYVLENVLFFIPLGVLLPIVTCKKFNALNTIVLGAFFSLGLETMQLCTGRGYFQTDDIIMNTVGTAIGAFFILAFGAFIRRLVRLVNVLAVRTKKNARYYKL